MCQIWWNYNKWFSRNRHISEKAILHSITIFLVATHTLHLTRFFWFQRKIWELLVVCINTFSNIHVPFAIRQTINTVYSVMKENQHKSSHNAQQRKTKVIRIMPYSALTHTPDWNCTCHVVMYKHGRPYIDSVHATPI